MAPLFFTFEGLDGSGKSTHLKRAAEWLQQQGVAVEVTHQPGGTALGQRIRQAVLDPDGGHIDGRVELLLMFADRRHHLLETIEPALASGRHVLCDRFSDSTRAYQGHGRGVPLSLIDEVDRIATDLRRPDRTLLFDLLPEQARSRGQSSKRRSQKGGVDRIDAEGLAFYQRVRDGYLELVEAEPERFIVIDASGSREETWEQVRGALVLLTGKTKP
ncbi:MAG: dTMP kinase [Deltaproteobacteria bacterium]|nr:dTMP kinase [Deltaproteobacteria bacterium]